MPTRDDNVPDFMRVKQEAPSIFQKYEEAQAKAERLHTLGLAVIEAAEEEYNAHEGGRFVDAGLARAKTRAAVRNLQAARGA